MRWAARAGGVVGLVAVWALVFAPGGDRFEQAPSTDELTVEVLVSNVGVDGVWRAHRGDPSGELSDWPPPVLAVVFASVAVAGTAAAVLLRSRAGRYGDHRRTALTPLSRRAPPAISFA